MKCHDFIKETELTQCIRKTVSQSLLQRRPSVHAHHSTYPNFNLNPSAAKNTGTFWYNFVYKNEEGGPLSTSKNKITFDHQSRHSASEKGQTVLTVASQISWLVGALSPVSHKGLYQGWKQTSVYLLVIPHKGHPTSKFFKITKLFSTKN